MKERSVFQLLVKMHISALSLKNNCFSTNNSNPAAHPPSYNAAHTANNFPLRGSKLSDWGGGVRVTAFVAGGWVPANQRGTERLGLIAIADWHKTFCELRGPTSSSSGAASSRCGVDAAAAAAGLPPLDSISMVDYLRGDEPNSPRLELQVDSNVLLKGACE